METYSFLREFADSWFLVFMFTFFVGTWVWAFWPSLRSARDDAASIPLRDDAPAHKQAPEKTGADAVNNTDVKEADNG